MTSKPTRPIQGNKTYISVLPQGATVTIHRPDGSAPIHVKLIDYTLNNQAFKFYVEIDGKLAEGGMGGVQITPSILLRPYSPIELHQVPSIGYSPKMVYSLPPRHRVQEYVQEVKESFLDKARKHTMRRV